MAPSSCIRVVKFLTVLFDLFPTRRPSPNPRGSCPLPGAGARRLSPCEGLREDGTGNVAHTGLLEGPVPGNRWPSLALTTRRAAMLPRGLDALGDDAPPPTPPPFLSRCQVVCFFPVHGPTISGAINLSPHLRPLDHRGGGRFLMGEVPL